MLVFLVSNILWIIKLQKVGESSKAVADVARKCVRIMVIQFILLAGLLACEFVDMATVWDGSITAAVRDINGDLDPSLPQYLGPFLRTPVEAFSGAAQVLAMTIL